MEKYGIFDISDVSVSNLNASASDESRAFEMRLCEMSFFADSIAREIKTLTEEEMSVSEALALLSAELSFDRQDDGEGFISETEGGVRAFVRSLRTHDKANFTALLTEKLKSLGVSISESDFLFEAPTDESFVYVRSALADEAFDVFSQEYSDPRIVYADSFKKACFDVADGKCGYCILPFEERSSVRIPTISALVSDLDLKIVAITPVFGFEGNADMKYALIGRSFKIPERDELTDRYFEITVPKETVSLSELLTVSETFGESVYKIDTALSDGEDGSYYTVIFKDGGDSFLNLCVYLSLFAEEYTPVGIYKNIE